MTHVIQIFKSSKTFNKSNYTEKNRKLFNSLPNSFESTTGFDEDRTLHLPIEYKNYPGLESSSLIIIQDFSGFNPFTLTKDANSLFFNNWIKNRHRNLPLQENKEIFVFNQISTPSSFELFKILKSQGDNIELFLDYNSNSSIIGIPARENHKVCELKINKPIRYKINGKSDFTMTGRMERSFYEFDYIFELKGCIEKIKYLELNKIQTNKSIPINNCKLIDERKILK